MSKSTVTLHNLAASTDYRPGSVVSSEILRRKTGTITLFAFDKGQGLSEHTAPFDAFVHVVDGAARVTVSKKPYTVKKGEFIILPAGKPHSLKAVRKFKMMLVMIRS